MIKNQNRARDTKRVSDAQAIIKALELYKLDNKGQYPDAVFSESGSLDGWEASSKEAAGEFLAQLKPYGFNAGVPLDPVNDAQDGTFAVAKTNNRYTYAYYRYPAGNAGCDSARGQYYVFGILRTSSYIYATYLGSPGFSCTSRDWQADFSWVTGKFEK